MSEIKRMLEQYLKAKFRDKTPLSITRLDKLADDWESDYYLLTVEYGCVSQTRADWVWRFYSEVGSQVKMIFHGRFP